MFDHPHYDNDKDYDDDEDKDDDDDGDEDMDNDDDLDHIDHNNPHHLYHQYLMMMIWILT